MWKLRRSDLAVLERGARFLGSGGGGDPQIARLLVEQLWGDVDAIEVIDVDDLPADARVIHVGLVGSVTALRERVAAGGEFTSAFDRLREHLGPDAIAIAAGLESAGVNAFLPLLISLQRGVPFLDVDAMGRGLSWIDQTTYAAAGVPICPFVLAAPAGHTFVVDDTPGDQAERYARALTFQMGGWSAFAGYPVDRETCRRIGIAGTLRRCLDIGRATSLEALLAADELGARLIATGRVVDARWRYPEGFPRLTAIIDTHDPDAAHSPVRIEASNEFLLVVVDGEVVARSPQVICLVDRASGLPLSTEHVTLGTEVAVVALPAPARWLEPDVAARVAPEVYGIEIPEAAA